MVFRTKSCSGVTVIGRSFLSRTTIILAGVSVAFRERDDGDGPSPEPCRFAALRAEYDALASNAAFSAIERPGVTVFDPYPIFCDEARGRCLAADEGVPLYRDDNHLWSKGARMLGAELAEAVREGEGE